MFRSVRSLASILTPLLLAVAACDGGGDVEPTPRPATRPSIDVPEVGATEFVSADRSAGERTPEAGAPEADNGAAEGEGDYESDRGTAPDDDGTRAVEEGDIYRVMSNGMIANLNAYRGLQLIDVSDVDKPTIVGRLQVSGYPVEMYVDGSRVIVLMNNWYGYYGVRQELASLAQQSGGVVVVIDITDPTRPQLVDQAFVPGSILKSRLTKGNISRALYVAASEWSYEGTDDVVSSSGQRTVVKSFDVASGTIVERSRIDLGGWVTDIQATPRALLVARHDWSYNDYNEPLGSRVAVIDITSPDGEMVQGGEVQVAGYVENQFRMSLEGDILRVASGSSWGGTNTNHLETFNAADLGALTPVDHVTYGDNEQLYATLFLEDRAFAVTYFRVDPFHAFSITADGFVTEESEFVVSGWNDFFKPTLDATRLIGVGTNDESGRTMSVSLYDITDLSNPNPLVARADIATAYSWSEASWDHRAFSVIEGAVDVTTEDGTRETGLVLLPFSGYSEDGRYSSAVQIFTYSASSLTLRGTMEHGTPVRRSFNAAEGLTANLSDAALSLFDTTAPDAPVAHGSLELAPNSTDILVFGDYAARVNRKADYYYGWYGQPEELPASVVEIISLAEDPDAAVGVASVEVPAEAQLYAAGDKLVAVSSRVIDWNVYPYTTETRVQAWDLSDPTVPVPVGELTTDRLASSSGGGYVVADCWDCGRGWGYASVPTGVATKDALSFLKRTPQQEVLGRIEECNTWANEPGSCNESGETCTYVEGGIYCRQPDGEARQCSGEFRRCTYTYTNNEYQYECEPVDEDTIDTQTNCYEYDNVRYWDSFSLEVLDLRDSPVLLDSIALADADEGVGMVSDRDTLWLTTKRPVDVPGSDLDFVRYEARPVDLGNLDRVAVGAPVNVPGELLAVAGDTLYTRDYLYGEDIVVTSVNRLRLEGDHAVLEAIHIFEREMVVQIVLDGSGKALVTHQLAWPFVQTNEDYATRLTVLDADGSMDALSTTVVDAWATLQDARQGRALFQVPGGLLVFDVEDGAAPSAQAFFPLRGWPSRIVVTGDDAIVPAGRFGVYRFALDTFNLLTPED